MQLRLEDHIDVAIGYFDFGIGVVLPRARQAVPVGLPHALVNSALSAGKSIEQYVTDNENSHGRCLFPGEKPPCFFAPAWPVEETNVLIYSDWAMLQANLTRTAQWLNLQATPRDLLRVIWIEQGQVGLPNETAVAPKQAPVEL